MRQAAPRPAPPAARPLREPRPGTFGVLDIGTSKVVCVIARVEHDGVPRALGHGWQGSRGVRAGSIVDMEAAEGAIRHAVAEAERQAEQLITGAIVSLSCGQPESRVHHILWPVGGRAVTEADLRAILAEGVRRTAAEGRESVHAFPLGFGADATGGVEDPRGMVCDTLAARLHVVDAATHALRNLGETLHRCELEADELVSAPFAAGLATLVEDERELGAVAVEMGAGTTSLAAFGEGRLLHAAQLPVGGWQVTSDLARMLSTPIAHAERLKTMHGSVLESGDSRTEVVAVPRVGEEDQIARVPLDYVVRIIRPRLEETFELLRDRLEGSGLAPEQRRRIVLTGGASQLIGARELAQRVLGRDVTVRLGRPRRVPGLPESMAGPAFAGVVGMLAWAAGEGRPLLDLAPAPAPRDGLASRLLRWVRERL